MEMRAGAVQLNSTADKARNLEVAEGLVRAAARDGADLVVLPEKWNLLGGPEELLEGAEPLDGPTITAARSWARELGIHLVAGSIAEQASDGGRPFNTSPLIGPGGELEALYRKIHMFDVDLDGVAYRESEQEQAGAEPVTASLDGALEGLTIGMTICYDLRFPELFRILAVRGANLTTVPSAFTLRTGRDHWEVLVRARAIENQAFVVAPDQVGRTAPHYDSYGRSMIVDPWGVVLAQASDRPCAIVAELDFEAQDRVRTTLPSLANRRPEAYSWPTPEELNV